MKNTRLSGHGLRYEGRVAVGYRYRSSATGPGVCECGEFSEPLPNAAQRKRWHAEHKDAVRAAQQADGGIK